MTMGAHGGSRRLDTGEPQGGKVKADGADEPQAVRPLPKWQGDRQCRCRKTDGLVLRGSFCPCGNTGRHFHCDHCGCLR